MPQRDFSTYADPLDILRRFIPAPLKASYRIGSVRVIVQTNDFALLPTLPLLVNLEAPGGQTMEWKLIRDTESHGSLQAPTILASRALTVVEMGPACVLGLDHERRELLGFIGADIDARTHQGLLVPFLCQMAKDAFSTDSISVVSGGNEEPTHD